ncbi:GGDEF domain-containing protein [Pseudanabaena sp. Chao 1811]|uniref:GGDEF domain-containing protein n=1 Tax=Pseudanabaena sp. Chao 1811 TaxID=2963092 RepID=UPI0022F3D5D8|nr:GGDEF domain-containing protein [Pseudanabaena sp. Chao 1811]
MNVSEYDGLTGLKNRKSLQKCFDEYSEANSRFGLILIDVDGLIYFNDFYGHVEGDEKLKQIADLLCQNVPNGVDVFRSAGDEFTILLKDLNIAEVVALVMQICKAVNQTFAHMPPLRRFYGMRDRSRLEVHYPLTVSCGVAFYPEDGTTYEDLYRAIDEILFRAGKPLLGGVVALVRNSESE